MYNQNNTKILAHTLLYMLKCTIASRFKSNFREKCKNEQLFNEDCSGNRESNSHTLIYANFQ